MTPLSSLQFSDLTFHEELGQGGFATVHRVTFNNDINGITQAAAKNAPNMCPDEVDILQKVHHKNIVRLFTYIKSGPVNLILLELATNGSLYDRLHCDARPVSETLATKWSREAGLAVQYLHDHGILHRDIKSRNCLLFEGDVLKLADFGIARQINTSQTTSTAKGTWQYMAPEVHKEGHFSKPSDIYAFGMLLYEIYVRKVPFHGNLGAFVVFHVASNGMLPEVPKSCSPEVRRLMHRCWNYSGKMRPTIQDVLEALQTLAISEGGEDLKTASPKQKKTTQNTMMHHHGSPHSRHLKEGSVAWMIRKCYGQERPHRMSSLTSTGSMCLSMSRHQQTILGTTWCIMKHFGHVGPGKLSKARGVVVSPNTDIAIADYNAQQVMIYDKLGVYKFSLDTTQGLIPGQKSYPRRLAVTSSGNIFVTDGTPFVKVYDTKGHFSYKFPSVSPQNIPSHADDTTLVSLASNRNNQIYVGEIKQKYISKHEEDGSHILSTKSSITPWYMATTSDDNLIISSFPQQSVHIISQDGDILHRFPSPPGVTNWLPCGLCCNDDVVLTSNYAEGEFRIDCYSVNGKHLGCVTKQVTFPCGLSFTQDGRQLIVAQSCGHGATIFALKQIH